MTIQDALLEFNQNNHKVKESLQKLREEVKKQTSYHIQEHMLSDQFEKANQMMRNLESFIQLELETNAEDIARHIEALYVNGSSDLPVAVDIPRPAPVVATPPPSSPTLTAVRTDALTRVERDIIEAIGYTGAAKLEDLHVPATEDNIQSLQQKGYLQCESTSWSANQVSVFYLTTRGKQYFQDTCGDVLVTPTKKERISFDLLDVERQLENAGFEILNRQKNIIEIVMEFKSCYLMVPERDVTSQMNERNHLKNIGFVCRDEQHINEVYEQVKQWVAENKDKSKCLSLHYTTLQTLQENRNNPFRSVHF